MTVNHAENYFSIFKRGVMGTFHSISEAHLNRYLKEFDFRYSRRSALGIEDEERAAMLLKSIEGKRVTYNHLRSIRGPHKPPWTPSDKPGRPPDTRPRKRLAKD